MNQDFKDFNLKILAEGGLVQYGVDFLSEDEANKLFLHLKDNTPWVQNYYTNFETGNKLPMPRLTAWYADDSNMTYIYSGIREAVLPWTPELLIIKEQIEKYTGHQYNSVLLNYYRDGNDSVGFHADDEKELGKDPTIASLSLGAPREFILKQDKVVKGNNASKQEVRYMLTNGSLLVMGGTTQHYWKHSIPKVKYYVDARINLTFRQFIQPGAI